MELFVARSNVAITVVSILKLKAFEVRHMYMDGFMSQMGQLVVRFQKRISSARVFDHKYLLNSLVFVSDRCIR